MYWIVLYYHPYLVSLVLCLVTVVMFFNLVYINGAIAVYLAIENHFQCILGWKGQNPTFAWAIALYVITTVQTILLALTHSLTHTHTHTHSVVPIPAAIRVGKFRHSHLCVEYDDVISFSNTIVTSMESKHIRDKHPGVEGRRDGKNLHCESGMYTFLTSLHYSPALEFWSNLLVIFGLPALCCLPYQN